MSSDKQHSRKPGSAGQEEAGGGAAPDADAPAQDARPQEPAQAAGETDAGEAGDADRDALLEQARREAREHWDTLLRTRAELENLHKRSAREIENAHKFALERFVSELLPVKDSLELGLSAARDGEADVGKLREGTELTLKMLGSALEKFGVQELDPEGKDFDPQYHEAMSTREMAGVEPGKVVTVVQKGYLLNGRLVRPAMVIVATEPGEERRSG